jgi:branched-subunit amino acid transport protein
MGIFLIVPGGIALLAAALTAITLGFVTRNKTAAILVGFGVFVLVFAGLLVFVPPPDF